MEMILLLRTRIKETTCKESLVSHDRIFPTRIVRSPMDSTRSMFPRHLPGYSQFARIYSSAVKCSLEQCQWMEASWWNRDLSICAFCSMMAVQRASRSIRHASPIDLSLSRKSRCQSYRVAFWTNIRARRSRPGWKQTGCEKPAVLSFCLGAGAPGCCGAEAQLRRRLRGR